MKEVSAAYDGSKQYKKLKGQPYRVSLGKHQKVRIKIEFYKWMGEPDYEIDFDECKDGILKISYDPKVAKWNKGQWLK